VLAMEHQKIAALNSTYKYRELKKDKFGYSAKSGKFCLFCFSKCRNFEMKFLEVVDAAHIYAL
jgi:hypothetical protein